MPLTEYDYEFKEDDIDFDAVALHVFEKLGMSGWSASALTKFDDRREHIYRSNNDSTDIRIDVTENGFKIFKIYQPWNRPEPELLKVGQFSELSMFSVERFLNSALRHGTDSEPDHEVGDLQEYLRAMWQLLTPQQKLDFVRAESVQATLTAAEGEAPKFMRESSR